MCIFAAPQSIKFKAYLDHDSCSCVIITTAVWQRGVQGSLTLVVVSMTVGVVARAVHLSVFCLPKLVAARGENIPIYFHKNISQNTLSQMWSCNKLRVSRAS